MQTLSHPLAGVTPRELAEAPQRASFSDETPEGRPIAVLNLVAQAGNVSHHFPMQAGDQFARCSKCFPRLIAVLNEAFAEPLGFLMAVVHF